MITSRVLGLAAWLAVSPVIAASGSETPLLHPSLREGIEKRLVQFEIRVTKKGVPVSGLTAGDFDIELGGKPLKGFTLDDMCVEAPTAAPSARPGSYVLYFDEPELTVEGRLRAVEVARLVGKELLARGHDVMILRNGPSLIGETGWTHDASAITEALDRIAADPGHRDFLSASVEESRIEDKVERLHRIVVENAMAYQRELRRIKGGSGPSGAKDAEIARLTAQYAAEGAAAVDSTIGELRTAVQDELHRTERDMERLRGALLTLLGRESPKGLTYFADSLRRDPGHVIASEVDELDNLPDRGMETRKRTLASWNADGAMQALIRDASTFGVRFYAVEGRGLSAPSDWVRSAQDTLTTLALDTGGLSFVNGLQASAIAGRIAADQSCWYLVSFDPKGWDEDRPHGLGVYPRQRGLRISTRSSIVIPSEASLNEARLTAAYLEGAQDGNEPLSVSIYPSGGNAHRLQVLAQVRLPQSDETAADVKMWDIGFAVRSRGTITAHRFDRLAWDPKVQAGVYQATLDVPQGEHEIVAVARDVANNVIRQGRVKGTWPAVSAHGVTLSVPAFAQPQRRGVVRDGESRAHGIVVLGDGDPIDPRDPVAIVTAVCFEETPMTALRAERQIEGRPEVSFPPMLLEPRKGQCLQIRDLVPAESVGTRYLSYHLRVVSESGTIASEEMTRGIAEAGVN